MKEITRRNLMVTVGATVLGIMGFGIEKYGSKKRHHQEILDERREQKRRDFETYLNDFMRHVLTHPGPFGIKPTGGMNVLLLEQGDKLEAFHLREGAGSGVKDGIVCLYSQTTKQRKHFYYQPNQGKETIVTLKDPVSWNPTYKNFQIHPEIVKENKSALRKALDDRGVLNLLSQDNVINWIVTEQTDEGGFPEMKIEGKSSNVFKNFLRRSVKTRPTEFYPVTETGENLERHR